LLLLETTFLGYFSNPDAIQFFSDTYSISTTTPMSLLKRTLQPRPSHFSEPDDDSDGLTDESIWRRRSHHNDALQTTDGLAAC